MKSTTGIEQPFYRVIPDERDVEKFIGNILYHVISRKMYIYIYIYIII
jgi:hypothetical protein